MNNNNVQKALEEIDNYEQSLNACLTFVHIYKWDERQKTPDATVVHWFGKEYNPGAVTPDVTIQLSSERGMVVEAKDSLPKNEEPTKDYWEKTFEQIKKYDAELEGWETEDKKIKRQELVLLIDQKIARRVIDYIKQNSLVFTNFSKNFCVVQYSPATGIKNGVFLRIEDGKVDDFKTITNQRLKDGIAVAYEFLFSSGLSQIKFLDHRPPAAYLMSILWDHVFNTLLSEEDWRHAKMEGGRKLLRIPVTVQLLRDELIKNFADKKSKQSIKESWVEEVLQNFVRLKLATRKKGGEYIIKYRKKIADESPDTNKHRIFAELLYGEDAQMSLEESLKKTKK